jgi:CHASE2 domain-containing sensor protein
MPLYLRIKPDGERIDSLSLALAAPVRGTAVQGLKKPPRLLRWAVQRTSEFKEAKETPIEAELFLVDYGALEGFERYAVRAANREALLHNAQALKGKRVLIGDGSLNHQDLHSVPNRRQPVPGVFIHASAAWTLRYAPIYELTSAGRITIDFALASAIVLITFWSGPLLSRCWRELPEHQIERRVSWCVCGIAFLVGVVLVHWTRVMWDDFLFVIVGLLVLHGWVKQALAKVWSGTRFFTARLFSAKTRS